MTDRHHQPTFENLPTLDPPPTLWSAIRSDLDRRSRARRLRRAGWITSAAAAIAVLAIVVHLSPLPDPDTGSVATEPAGAEISDQSLIEIRQLSALLEARLRQQHFSAVSSNAMESLVWLENELTWLDMRLASHSDDLELWQRRTELLAEMNRLYERNHWQTQMRQASF
jgi:hypothetical protein